MDEEIDVQDQELLFGVYKQKGPAKPLNPYPARSRKVNQKQPGRSLRLTSCRQWAMAQKRLMSALGSGQSLVGIPGAPEQGSKIIWRWRVTRHCGEKRLSFPASTPPLPQ